MTTSTAGEPLPFLRLFAPLLATGAGLLAIVGPAAVPHTPWQWVATAFTWLLLMALGLCTLMALTQHGHRNRKVWGLLTATALLSAAYFTIFALAVTQFPLSVALAGLSPLLSAFLASTLYMAALLPPALQLCLMIEELHHPRSADSAA